VQGYLTKQAPLKFDRNTDIHRLKSYPCQSVKNPCKSVSMKNTDIHIISLVKN